jgi:hypothetical protein
MSFADYCCLLEIHVPAGTKVLPIWNLSKNPHEMEVLLPKGGHLAYVEHAMKRGVLTLTTNYHPAHKGEHIPSPRRKSIQTLFDEWYSY